MTTPENPHAGQGPVLLDIGGDIGALVVTMPAEMQGLEVELRRRDPVDHHAHHDGAHPHHPHVSVLARPSGTGLVHTLVYPSVPQGRYDLVPIPGDTVVMTVTVTGGAVTNTRWMPRKIAR